MGWPRAGDRIPHWCRARLEGGEGQRVAGIRTFAVIGLLGGVSGLLLPAAGALPVAARALAFGVAFAAFQFREAVEDGDNSITSTVAGLLAFALGLYAVVGAHPP